MDDPVVCMTECKKSEWWSKLPSRHEIEFLLLLPLSFSSFHSLLCALSWECALWEENMGTCTNNSYFPIFFSQCTIRKKHRVKNEKSWSNVGYYTTNIYSEILGFTHEGIKCEPLAFWTTTEVSLLYFSLN